MAIRAGRTTSAELVEAALAVIAARNAESNAFILVDEAGAREQARLADIARHGGRELGPLHGLPLSLKDLIDVAGQPTTAASVILKDSIASADAPIVTRLRAAGAVLIGKTNLHEFAVGPTSEDSAYGPVRHPRDRTHMAGGSSGGSAVAVATGMGLASIGSDTGGSIRIPAAACGVVGLKPSLRDVPTGGVIPLSPTLDHVGPLTRTVEDTRVLWRVLADRAGVARTPVAPTGVRLAVLDGLFTEHVDETVASAFARALSQLAHYGATITHVSMAGLDTVPTTYAHLVLPEGAAWHATWLDERPGDYFPIVRSRLEAGRKMLAVDYLHARQRRHRLRQTVDDLLKGVAAIVLPTIPVVAPLVGQDEVELHGQRAPTRPLLLRNTQLFNITGHPAITLPINEGGWPVGFQLVGHINETPALLDLAEACEAIICQ
jgi:aspartyl-tRNA(Asn)/glutamyl-tRNA(Gln) amidotransferase subunit A